MTQIFTSKPILEKSRLISNIQRVLAVAAGEKIVRFLPPLIISKTDIDIACEKIEKVLKEIK